ncbi:maltotransferase domain-containing protein, partial [Streptomyces sp. NPDC058751]|uniref:maltotransferase domain-containing protein n=1 Tax=Streptomyces sp. NPDC058751 TaxID=3346623 RepID=UPI0036B488C2
MPATHHTSPPPTTTPETPRTRAAEAGRRTPATSAAPAASAASGKPSATPGASGSEARPASTGTTPGTTGQDTGAPASEAPATEPKTSSAAASAAGTPARRGAATGTGARKTARSAPRTAGPPAPKAARSSVPKATGPSAAKTSATGTGKSAPKGGKAAPKAGRASVPATRAPDAPLAAAAPATAVGRIPVLDVRPVVQQGRRPAKAVVGEEFEVSATVFREGHDAVAANVVLRGPDGRPGPWTPMRELAPGTDRWGARVSAGAEGRWTYTVEAWSDPVTTWRHHAGIKIPAGLDTELVLEEGALLYERAAAGLPKGTRGKKGRDTLLGAVDALRDTGRPVASRLAAALTPQVDAVLAGHPLRELVTSSEPLPLLVERERALYGAWYEFFPRSESGQTDPAVHGTFRTAAERLPAIA